jgi:hypothetical protein
MSRFPLFVAGVLAWSAVAVQAGEASDVDVVILDNHQRIVGKLEDDPESADWVQIKLVTGTIRLRRSRVAAVELGVTSRFKALKEDDLDGLIAFARWARSKGHQQAALTALDKAFAIIRLTPEKPFDLAALALYARLTDEIQGPDAAIALYRWYRKAQGTDSDTLARLNQLEAIVGKSDGDGIPAVATLPPPPEPDKAAASGSEGYEVKGWQSENSQYSNPVQTEVVPLLGEDRLDGVKRALKVTFAKGDKGKAAIKKAVNIDATTNHVLSLQVKVGDAPVKFAIAVKTGNWVFQESLMQTVKAADGWKELRFDLKDATFKSQKSEWANNSVVADLDDVKEIQVLVYNGEAEGSTLISGMRFLADKEL